MFDVPNYIWLQLLLCPVTAFSKSHVLCYTSVTVTVFFFVFEMKVAELAQMIVPDVYESELRQPIAVWRAVVKVLWKMSRHAEQILLGMLSRTTVMQSFYYEIHDQIFWSDFMYIFLMVHDWKDINRPNRTPFYLGITEGPKKMIRGRINVSIYFVKVWWTIFFNGYVKFVIGGHIYH